MWMLRWSSPEAAPLSDLQRAADPKREGSEWSFPVAGGLLFGRSLLIVREAELLAPHQSSPGLRTQNHCRADRLGFTESPQLSEESKELTTVIFP
jgi:hypothetical protein